MKKTKILIFIFLLGALGWYLFIKPHDYSVRFKIKTSPGTLSNGVEEWNLIGQELDSFTYKITNKNAYRYINQRLNIKKRKLDFNWNFNSLNDTITHVIVNVSEKEKFIYNRLTIPFFNTQFKKTTLNLIQDYKKGIENQLEKKFKIRNIRIDTIPETAYAYIEFKDIDMRNKAKKMMKYNSKLLEFIHHHKLKNGNYPFLMIDNWDLNKNKIDFRFCFPIKQKDAMPIHEYIKFDILKVKKVLKVDYFGNYTISDRAWFALHEYAKRHDISIENKPLEIFYSNPHFGGNELEWKAEIFMPIK